MNEKQKDVEATVTQAITRAERLLNSALHQQTDLERNEAAKMGRLMKDAAGKAFTFAMVDEVFRSKNPQKSAASLRKTLSRYGAPKYMPLFDRTLIQVGAVASYFLPKTVMQGVAARMRADSARVILRGEVEPLHQYLEQRKRDGFRINLNHLGEAILGEEEAQHRMDAILGHLSDPHVHYISVKISAIFSQINLIAWEHTLGTIKDRLRILYRKASELGKFVNLDMEEYRDLELTIEAFQSLLEEEEFKHFSAGIVLQAYLPDSWEAQQRLTRWAIDRVEQGGAPIKIRIVKGANLAMEAVEAELHGWYSAPYPTKSETDANFRRLMEFGCRPENAKGVKLGVASHNLFDVALALTLREENRVESFVEIEMLEGMANHQARAVRDEANGLLLYSPAVKSDDFLSAMAYLVRRLDENTSPENFLRDMFAIRPGSPEWIHQKERFERGWKERETVTSRSRREMPAVRPSQSITFLNEPDTDWTHKTARDSLAEAQKRIQRASEIPLPDLETMLSTASRAQSQWEALGMESRAEILNRVAEVMSSQRFEALSWLQSDGKKSIHDADGEVSEAIDFARYYARTWELPDRVRGKALGIVAVVSPWNFPYAIPAGGVLAALMAGNSVVLKPAPATVLTAWFLVNQLWNAGVPRDVLHFYPCANEQGERFLSDPRIQSIVLTGSYETAKRFKGWRPELQLLAETSGKNALVITAQSDRELAIKDLVRSAFGHAGQKCSAASLAILEAEVYDDPHFRRQLRDAAMSLPVGPAALEQSVVTPIVIPTTEKLKRALTVLDEGEEWLLKPELVSDSPTLWSPGIKLGVKENSWFHKTECFGPVLGLMRADSLAHAVLIQNGTEFGLTAGIHSLDRAEIQWWKENVQAGNLYVNRPITGAIVQRQPFGGWKKSCVGPGAKAGGPNYVHQFMSLTEDDRSEVDYSEVWKSHFMVPHDPSSLRCESNVFRYRKCKGVILRISNRDQSSLQLAQQISELTGVPLVVSFTESESDADFVRRLPTLALEAEFLRTVATPASSILVQAFNHGLNWICAPFLKSGRMELLRWLREQSVSQTKHRYGQLPDPNLD